MDAKRRDAVMVFSRKGEGCHFRRVQRRSLDIGIERPPLFRQCRAVHRADSDHRWVRLGFRRPLAMHPLGVPSEQNDRFHEELHAANGIQDHTAYLGVRMPRTRKIKNFIELLILESTKFLWARGQWKTSLCKAILPKWADGPACAVGTESSKCGSHRMVCGQKVHKQNWVPSAVPSGHGYKTQEAPVQEGIETYFWWAG